MGLILQVHTMWESASGRKSAKKANFLTPDSIARKGHNTPELEPRGQRQKDYAWYSEGFV